MGFVHSLRMKGNRLGLQETNLGLPGRELERFEFFNQSSLFVLGQLTKQA